MERKIINTLETESLVIVSEMVERLKETNSTKDKELILSKYEGFKEVEKFLYYLYNPHLKYGISESKLDEIEGSMKNVKEEFVFPDLYSFLVHLSISNINDDLRGQIGILLNLIEDKKIKELVKCLLIKDLKVGLGIKTVNKVFKDLIPTHEVQLAKKYEPGKTKLKDKFFVTEKLDGIRCTAYFEGNELKIKTRQGKDIAGLVEIEKVLMDQKEKWNRNILDGELISIGSSPEDVYKHTMEKVQNKNEAKTGVQFKVFDIVPLGDFVSKKSTIPYGDRRSKLLSLENSLFGYSEFIKLVPVLYEGKDENEILPLLDKVVSEGKEGLMINLDKPYEFKRTANLLKVKKMHTMDLEVVGFEEGTGKNKNNLGALLVDFKGNKVGVGSGLTDSLRKEIWENKEKYLGRIAEIQYFEISKDKNGIESLRFPVLKTFREEGKEVSYY
jgi:DNA ligase-1